MVPPRVFLLSPARLDGERGRQLLQPVTLFPVAKALRTREGCPIGEVFRFVSGLYFRGKLAYGNAFARAPEGAPWMGNGALVITQNRGMVPVHTRVCLEHLEAFASTDIHANEPSFRKPFARDAQLVADAIGKDGEVVLLGSIASAKYVDVLVEVDELGGEPEELVNLALTTGPVPVMVPRPSVASSTLPALTPNPRPVDPAAKPSTAAAVTDAGPVRGEASSEQAEAGVSSSVAMYNATDEDEDGVVPNADEVATHPDVATGTDDVDDQAGTADTGIDADGEMSLLDDSTVDNSTVEEVTVEEVTVEEHGPMASVVSLFAGELESRSADRTQSQSRVAVDQLFAKLKVAKAEEIARDVEQSVAAPTSIRQAPKKRSATESSHDAGEVPVGATGPEDVSVFEHRDELLAALTASVARKLKRVLADEQNEVLDVLRRKEPVGDLDTLVPLEPEHARSYAQVIHDDLYTAATGGAKFSDPAGDPQRRIADAGIIDTLLAEVEEAVVQPLRERLYAAVAAQSSNDKLGQTVRGIYREWKTSVLDFAAADLAASAYARGVAAVLVPGTAVSWIISPANPACGECSTNAAAGVVQFGDAFPTGDLSSPAHLGCRCLIVAAGRR